MTTNSAMAIGASGVTEMPERERPLSEQFRIVALQYADAHSAANLLEELKTTTLEKIKTGIMDQHKKAFPDASVRESMSENRAERIAKCSPQWDEYIREMCGLRAKADKLKLQMKYIEYQFSEWQAADANARKERFMSR